MDALTTARRVLTWARSPIGVPPLGPLHRPTRLAAPEPEDVAAVAATAVVTAARLGAGTPPLGDPGPVGAGALLIAAALGGRLDPDAAAAVLEAVPPLRPDRTGWAEALSRHGVAGPALTRPIAGLPGTFTERLRVFSPLTAVLDRPPSDRQLGTPQRTALRLVGRPHGAALLVAALAAPSADTAVLEWRATLLEAFRRDRVGLALDVYEAAFLWHGPAWHSRIGWAAAELRGIGRTPALPLAVLRFWAPLARIQRDELGAAALAARSAPAAASGELGIRGRIYLRSDAYADVVALVHRHGLLPVEAA